MTYKITQKILQDALTYDRLIEVLKYDPDLGIFVWLISTSNRVRIGSVAGWKTPEGYIKINVDGRAYNSHRLAWFYVKGYWPTNHIDHVNGNGFDNRFLNLREADSTLNLANSARRKDNTSGFKGVSFNRKYNKWEASIARYGRQYHLGYYSKKENAHEAYCCAARASFGEFARFS